MSTQTFILFLITFFNTGSPTKAIQIDPPSHGIDLRVREIRTNRLPGSYQLTVTVTFE